LLTKQLTAVRVWSH